MHTVMMEKTDKITDTIIIIVKVYIPIRYTEGKTKINRRDCYKERIMLQDIIW